MGNKEKLGLTDRIADDISMGDRCGEWEKFRGESPMQKALSELGLTPVKAAELLAKELEACTVKAQVVEQQEVVTTGEGSDAHVTVITTRKWSYSKPMVDWPTRQKARQDLNKLWGSIPKQTEGRGDDSSPLVIKVMQEGHAEEDEE